jgi:hypothetical protein
MASVISKYGDGAGNKHECTIVGEKEDLNDSDYLTYKLVMESTDEEDDAILLAAIAYGGCFTPTIYQAYR